MKDHEIIFLNLNNLFLDPNNYRLRSNKNYKYVNPKQSLLPAIQKKTMHLITGDGNINIQDLLESFKSNGYLKVDNILVRKFSSNSYIVVEGNRRVAALKALKEEYEKGNEIGKLKPAQFKNIEVVLHDSDNEYDYLILMGLKHVSGNKKWDRYNQAKLLYELKSKHHLSDIEIARRIGIQKGQVQTDIRGYLAVEKFMDYIKDENYGKKYNPYDKLMIFIEVTSKPKLKKWIGWNDDKLVFSNRKNMKRFFSWITPNSELDDETEEYTINDPIIVSHKEVRELEEIIDDEDSLNIMEENRDFKFALEQNSIYTKKQFSKSIKNVEKIMRNIKAGTSINMSREDKKSLNNIILICEKLLKS